MLSSTVAPFTSKKPSLFGVVHVLRHGRAAYAGRVAAYRSQLVDNVLLGHCLSGLFLKNVRFSMRQNMIEVRVNIDRYFYSYTYTHTHIRTCIHIHTPYSYAHTFLHIQSTLRSLVASGQSYVLPLPKLSRTQTSSHRINSRTKNSSSSSSSSRERRSKSSSVIRGKRGKQSLYGVRAAKDKDEDEDMDKDRDKRNDGVFSMRNAVSLAANIGAHVLSMNMALSMSSTTRTEIKADSEARRRDLDTGAAQFEAYVQGSALKGVEIGVENVKPLKRFTTPTTSDGSEGSDQQGGEEEEEGQGGLGIMALFRPRPFQPNPSSNVAFLLSVLQVSLNFRGGSCREGYYSRLFYGS